MRFKNNSFSFVALLLASAIFSSPVWGHASAQTSVPANGSTLSESPTELSIQFNGSAKLVALTITGSNGEPVSIDISDATSVDGRVNVAITTLQPDSYQVSWRAMGLDGHITSGGFGFVVSVVD